MKTFWITKQKHGQPVKSRILEIEGVEHHRDAVAQFSVQMLTRMLEIGYHWFENPVSFYRLMPKGSIWQGDGYYALSQVPADLPRFFPEDAEFDYFEDGKATYEIEQVVTEGALEY